MSKSKMNTQDKIVDKALEMFNERGIEYVGLRELAAVLGIRVSNITYYFPTKDDLVFALSAELGKANAGLITQRASLTMKAFLDVLHQVFLNHVKFRCLLLSVVHLMKQNKHMADTYKKTQVARNAAIRSNLNVMKEGRYLNIKNDEDLEFLASGISLISRFWISEAAITYPETGIEQQIRHYLVMITKMLMPYATSKGKKDIRLFLDTLSD